MRRLILILILSVYVLAQERQITVEKYEAPTYPQIARNARLWGTVKLELQVGRDGQVESAKVVSGSPHFEKTVLENIKMWRFKCFDCSSPQAFKHSFEYTFQINKVDCGEGGDDRILYAFPASVTFVAAVQPMHCGQGRIEVRGRSRLSRLFRNK